MKAARVTPVKRRPMLYRVDKKPLDRGAVSTCIANDVGVESYLQYFPELNQAELL